jgi:hypothetical protein
MVLILAELVFVELLLVLVEGVDLLLIALHFCGYYCIVIHQLIVRIIGFTQLFFQLFNFVLKLLLFIFRNGIHLFPFNQLILILFADMRNFL